MGGILGHMTRIALVACVCSLVAAGAAGAGLESADGVRASLHAVDMQPLVVRGTGFEPNERVRLMLSSADGQRWRTTDAGAAGRFTMRFGVSIGGCGRFSVQAFGSRGSRARLLPLRAQVDCMSPDGGDTTK
jgi:hypothetical protein